MHLYWIPANCAYPGNEATDAVDKEASAVSLPVYDHALYLSDLRSQFSSSIWSCWQVRWTSVRGQHSMGTHKTFIVRF